MTSVSDEHVTEPELPAQDVGEPTVPFVRRRRLWLFALASTVMLGMSSTCVGIAEVDAAVTQLNGKTSCFRDTTTSTGVSAETTPGVAVLQTSTLGDYWSVTFANGKNLVLKQIDYGPALSTNRVIDITAPATLLAGYHGCDSSDITDTVVSAVDVGKNPNNPVPTGAAIGQSGICMPV